MNTPDHHRFTQLLNLYSSHLDDLICEVRHPGFDALSPEFLDEVAVTIDELMLALDEHRGAHGLDDLAGSLLSDARLLRDGVRARALEAGQIAAAISDVTLKIGYVIRDDKRAA